MDILGYLFQFHYGYVRSLANTSKGLSRGYKHSVGQSATSVKASPEKFKFYP